MSPQTKDSIEKVAYTAVGAPIAAVKAVGARVNDLREAIRASRGELSEDLAKEFDRWVAEGERVVDLALKRLRKSEALDAARSTSEKMRERVTASVGEMRQGLDEALDIVEPDETLETISGIGPGYAKRLNEVGIGGIAAFLDRTSSSDEIEKVAADTGFTTDQVSRWRDQVDLTRVSGVGDSYLDLLHRTGVWTVGQLAKADPADLVQKMEQIDLPGVTDQTPSRSRLADWVAAAKKMIS